jgi:hypothetical protein
MSSKPTAKKYYEPWIKHLPVSPLEIDAVLKNSEKLDKNWEILCTHACDICGSHLFQGFVR